MSSVVDYQVFCPQGTPKEDRDKFRVGDIYSNAAKCLKCGDVIRSRNRHDYVQCSCKAVAVDGGSWCARRIGDPEDYEDMTEMYNDC